MAELREWLLDEKNGGDAIRRVSRGLTAEMIAAVAKLMSNLDLIYAAKKIRHRPLQHHHWSARHLLLPSAAQPHHR